MCVWTSQICVPHADYVLDVDFSHEETVHPAETELDEFDAFVFEVFGESCVYTGCEVVQGPDLSLDTGLSDNVVVFNTIEELGETPEGIVFYCIEGGARQLARVHACVDVGVCDV